MTRTALTLAALLFAASSCASEDGDDPKSRYSEECTNNGDCAEGLLCAGGNICTVSCTATGQCAGLGGTNTSCVSGYCREVCTAGSDCQRYGLPCVQNGSFALPPGRGVCQSQ